MITSRPPLPSYSDEEVSCFHPVFEYAANRALALVPGGVDIRVLHHESINGITVDFAFERKSTGKYILLAELKRTPSSTRGTRTRNQARSYYLEAKPLTETPYFLTSNLEITDLFRNDESRPVVSSQLIVGSPMRAGVLGSTSEEDFYYALENVIAESLKTALAGSGDYAEKFRHLHSALGASIGDASKWHQLLIPVAFEYIQSFAKKIPHLDSSIKTIGWRPTERYKNTPEKLIELGSRVDFAAIFKPPAPVAEDADAFSSQTLSDAYNAGKDGLTGDDLADLVNSLLSPTGPGIVETDDELAWLLAVIAKNALKGELNSTAVISDPAAGSGKLLTVASQVFKGLKPSQYWANEVNPLFAEALSLKLGLNHAASLTPTECPKVTISDIVILPKEDFEKVKVVFLNPPYISGVQNTVLKTQFARRISLISGRDSITNKGQIGLEAIFLELVWQLVPTGTVIAAILPHRYISGLSSEVVAFRRFLISQFGLTHVVSYPRDGLFEEVSKQTIIFAGVKGAESDREIKLVDVQIALENVNYAYLSSGLQSGDTSPARGIEVKQIAASDLLCDADDGWACYLGNRAKIQKWANNLFAGYKKLEKLGKNLRRGSSGNGGCADLSIFNSTDTVGKLISSFVPTTWLEPGINNADVVPKLLDVSTAPEMGLIPPLNAYKSGTSDFATMRNIIHAYQLKPVKVTKGQLKAQKTSDEIADALRRNQKLSPAYSVLIPRALRVEGKVGVTIVPAVVSTNFIIAEFSSEIEAKIVASWLFSVFGQIQMELNFSNQEGMRKLEKEPVGKIMYPDISLIPSATQTLLIDAFIADSPIKFKNPKSRSVDALWAQIVSPLDHVNVMNSAFDLFRGICEDRNP